MIPVDQTAFELHDGNCFSACVASILELPIEAVPTFDGALWFADFLDWLAPRGLSATFCGPRDVPRGISIAGGPSRRFAGRMHACVAIDGAVVHDPHPSREGLPSGITSYVAIHAAI